MSLCRRTTFSCRSARRYCSECCSRGSRDACTGGKRSWADASFADAEAAEDPSEQIIAGDFRKGALRTAQLLGHEFPCAPFNELTPRLFQMTSRTRERLEVTAPGRNRPAAGCLESHAGFEVRSEQVETFAGQC